MMNKILQDLINTEKVAKFIDNILIETEKEGQYNEIVEEVVKILAENDLYIKPKKYKWKISAVTTTNQNIQQLTKQSYIERVLWISQENSTRSS